MLISEKKLRSIIREILGESISSGFGGGPITSSVKQGEGGYVYEIFSNGKIQILRKGKKTYNPPLVLNQKQAAAVANEQIKLGNRGDVVARIASGELTYDPAQDDGAAAPSTPAQPVVAATGPRKGVILIGRQDFFPIKSIAGSEADELATRMFGQGHGFAVVIDEVGTGHRFDFGRYPEAESCEDKRWITQAGVAVAEKFGFGKDPDPKKNKTPQQWFGSLGIHTMGTLVYHKGSVKAILNSAGQITNMGQFCKGLRKPKGESATDIVAVPVNDANAALQFAKERVGKCMPYALPGAQVLTYRDTENCGTMAQKILMAGRPDMVLSVETKTLVDTPDALYNNLVSSGQFQTCKF